MKRFELKATALLLAAGMGLGAGVAWSADSLQDVLKARGLSQQDLLAAAKTYVPTGKRDEFVAFSSGGQSGQIIVYGVPSMRILKYIGVFTPEPWQGYGFDESSKKVLAQGRIDGKDITWGDTHHPAISETNGEYDGQFLFINDKANPRLAVIDLRDFETKQIVVNPIMKSEHGGAFVTTNTEYVIEAAQYPSPLENKKFYPLEEMNEKYRGAVTYWKFDRKEGRILPNESFSFELPPYWQDLSDAGKGASEGWSFTNSFCSERYVGGIEKGRPPYEAGCSAKDTDYLHVFNWKKAVEVVKAGKGIKTINGHKVIPMEVSIKEGLLFLIPEPKSPHGVDVTPDGKHIVVAGKLDTHVSVYSFEKIQAAIKAGKFESKDAYGIPVIGMKDALHTQVSLGLGPLHTQYDSKPCVAYTSLYVDSQVAKWNYCEGKVLDKISVHYNIGHLMTMEGDSTKPAGKYLVALNKLSIDRFVPVGPLQPQSHQLIDISGDKMQLLYDMPVPLGEPHYVVAIDAKKLKPAVRYKVGTDSRTDKPHPGGVKAGEEKIVKKGNKVEVFATLIRSHITPGNHRSGCRRRGDDQPDQPRAGAGRDPRLHGIDLQRACVGRAGQDGGGQVQGRQGRCLSLLLHGVLLRPAPGDDGLPAGQAEGLEADQDRTGQGQLHGSGLQGDREEGGGYPGDHRLRRGLHHQRQLQGLPGCRGDGGRCLRPAGQDQGPEGEA